MQLHVALIDAGPAAFSVWFFALLALFVSKTPPLRPPSTRPTPTAVTDAAASLNRRTYPRLFPSQLVIPVLATATHFLRKLKFRATEWALHNCLTACVTLLHIFYVSVLASLATNFDCNWVRGAVGNGSLVAFPGEKCTDVKTVAGLALGIAFFTGAVLLEGIFIVSASETSIYTTDILASDRCDEGQTTGSRVRVLTLLSSTDALRQPHARSRWMLRMYGCRTIIVLIAMLLRFRPCLQSAILRHPVSRGCSTPISRAANLSSSPALLSPGLLLLGIFAYMALGAHSSRLNTENRPQKVTLTNLLTALSSQRNAETVFGIPYFSRPTNAIASALSSALLWTSFIYSLRVYETRNISGEKATAALFYGCIAAAAAGVMLCFSSYRCAPPLSPPHFSPSKGGGSSRNLTA